MLAGAPVEIAPTAQGIWMRGASLTMLHQPTPRTDLQRWAEETTAVINMIGAKAVIVSDPFMPAAPLLSELGMRVLTIEQLLDGRPIDPVETDDDDLALLQLTSGSTGSPKAVQITHRNFVSNAEAMFIGAQVDVDTDVIVSWLPLFHDMGMTGFLTVPMYFGVELVKVTPMDFLRDTLLWAKLIDKYKGTMTAAPNFAYTLFAKRLRRQARPASSTCPRCGGRCRAPSRSSPPTSRTLCEAGKPFGLRPEAILPAYGMAETTVAVSFSECGAGLVVDEVDADLLAVLHRAVPATRGKTRRLATLGRLLKGLRGARRRRGRQHAARPRRRRHPGARRAGDARATQRWPDSSRRKTTRVGMTPATWAISPRPATSWSAAGSRTSSSWPAATSTRPTSNAPPPASPGSGPAVPWRCAWTPGTRGKRSPSRWSPTTGRIRPRCVASSIKWPTRWSPRSMCGPATWLCCEPGMIPKTPSGKLRRAHALGARQLTFSGRGGVDLAVWMGAREEECWPTSTPSPVASAGSSPNSPLPSGKRTRPNCMRGYAAWPGSWPAPKG